MCIYIYVYMYVCIYIYIYIYTHVNISLLLRLPRGGPRPRLRPPRRSGPLPAVRRRVLRQAIIIAYNVVI